MSIPSVRCCGNVCAKEFNYSRTYGRKESSVYKSRMRRCKNRTTDVSGRCKYHRDGYKRVDRSVKGMPMEKLYWSIMDAINTVVAKRAHDEKGKVDRCDWCNDKVDNVSILCGECGKRACFDCIVKHDMECDEEAPMVTSEFKGSKLESVGVAATGLATGEDIMLDGEISDDSDMELDADEVYDENEDEVYDSEEIKNTYIKILMDGNTPNDAGYYYDYFPNNVKGILESAGVSIPEDWMQMMLWYNADKREMFVRFDEYNDDDIMGEDYIGENIKIGITEGENIVREYLEHGGMAGRPESCKGDYWYVEGYNMPWVPFNANLYKRNRCTNENMVGEDEDIEVYDSDDEVYDSDDEVYDSDDEVYDSDSGSLEERGDMFIKILMDGNTRENRGYYYYELPDDIKGILESAGVSIPEFWLEMVLWYDMDEDRMLVGFNTEEDGDNDGDNDVITMTDGEDIVRKYLANGFEPDGCCMYERIRDNNF